MVFSSTRESHFNPVGYRKRTEGYRIEEVQVEGRTLDIGRVPCIRHLTFEALISGLLACYLRLEAVFIKLMPNNPLDTSITLL